MTASLLGLEGRWVLVTGGTRGIGRATVHALAGLGANVAVTSRKQEDADLVADEAASRYDVATFAHAADVGDLQDVKRLVDGLVAETGGRLDAAILNAGYPVVPEWWNTHLADVPEEGLTTWFDTVRRVDLDGSRYLTWALLPHMVRERRGSFVYVSSTPALSGYKGAPYTEAKAAILGLMRDVARQYGPKGVRANAIAPGNIRTSWMDALTQEEIEALGREGSLKRWGEPEEVARVAVFLVSEMASFVTGQTVIVDGGEVVR